MNALCNRTSYCGIFKNFLLLIVGLQMLRKMKGNINASHTAARPS